MSETNQSKMSLHFNMEISFKSAFRQIGRYFAGEISTNRRKRNENIVLQGQKRMKKESFSLISFRLAHANSNFRTRR